MKCFSSCRKKKIKISITKSDILKIVFENNSYSMGLREFEKIIDEWSKSSPSNSTRGEERP